MYLPILKSKAGEIEALGTINSYSHNSSNCIPLVELLPGEVAKTLDRIIYNWETDDNGLIIDPYIVLQRTGSHTSSIDLMKDLLAGGIDVIPTLRLKNDANYEREVLKLVTKHNLDLCIRIEVGYYSNVTGLLTRLSSLVEKSALNKEKITLVFDNGYLTEFTEDVIFKQLSICLNSLPNIHLWANVFVAGGSFPPNLAEFAVNTITAIQRREWDMWQRLKMNIKLAPHISYGDYGPRYPIYSGDVDFSPSCSIKYTTENSFIIFRGTQAKHSVLAGGQYHVKAREVVRHPLYDGPGFSWGDGEINNISIRTDKPGNAKTWVKITFNRHIEKLLDLV